MDDLTLASLTALLSETIDVYAEAKMNGRTPHEAQIKAVAWGARKASELNLAHGAMAEGAQRVIANVPNILTSMLREVWPSDVDTAHMLRISALLKRKLPEALVINLF